jgi:Caspase domain
MPPWLQLAGNNYLVPIDANLTSVSDIRLQAMNVDDIFQHLRLHTSAQLIFLDACRSNPATGQKYWVVDALKTADQDRGLARSVPSVGSLIAYATEPGKVAFDGSGPNSPYTSALIHHVNTPNQEIREMLTRVRRDVIAATGGRQVPWETSSLVDDVYLVRAPAPPVVAPLTQLAMPTADEPEPLDIPLPRASSDAPLLIAIDRLPDKGCLLVGGKALTGPVQFGPDTFKTLAFEPSGLAPGTMSVMSYAASDPYNQMSRGVVAITVVAPSGETRSGYAEAQARGNSSKRLSATSLIWTAFSAVPRSESGLRRSGLWPPHHRKARTSTCLWSGHPKMDSCGSTITPDAWRPSGARSRAHHHLRAQDRLGCRASWRICVRASG